MKNQLTPGRHTAGLIAVAVLFGSMLAANYVTTDYGFVPVGFGLSATAGTFFAGFALAARDAINDVWGRLAVVAVILIGTLVSFTLSALEIAIVSAAAFLVSESLDFVVYVPLRKRAKFGDKKWALAVVASNIVGAITDTVVFLGVAFGSAAILPALPGQLVGKLYATIVYLLIGWAIARLVINRFREPVAA